MEYDALLKWLEGTSVAQAIAESESLFPWIEAVHVLAITLVVGSIAIVDLRLIGFASRNHAVTSLTKDVLPCTWVAERLGGSREAVGLSPHPRVLTQTWKTTRIFFRQRARMYDIVEGVCMEGYFRPATDKWGNAIFVPIPHDVGGNRVPPK